VVDVERNAYLRLSGCGRVVPSSFQGSSPRMACLDPDLCYVINDIALIPFSPALSQRTILNNNESSWKKRGCRLGIRDQRDATQEPHPVPVPDYHKHTVIDHWMYVCLRALTSMHDMQPPSCVRSGSRLGSEQSTVHVEKIIANFRIRVARPNCHRRYGQQRQCNPKPAVSSYINNPVSPPRLQEQTCSTVLIPVACKYNRPLHPNLRLPPFPCQVRPS
jgi:hypothetical protein